MIKRTRRTGSVGCRAREVYETRQLTLTVRRGSVAVELLLLTPIVIGLIVAVVEIGMMTAANEQMAGASREGCRVAALGGGPDEIRRAVWNHLGQGNLSSAKITAVITENNNGPIVVALTDSNGQPIYQTLGNAGYNGNYNSDNNGNGNDNGDSDNNGNNGNNNNNWPIPCGDPVLVRVETPTLNAVPDLLAILGISIQNSTLVGQTIMRKE